MKTKIFTVRTENREAGIRKLLDRFNLREFGGKKVAFKANYNSADPFPASTHLDTLRTLVNGLKEARAEEITLAERSGMGNTRTVLDRCGVTGLAAELGFEILVLDKLTEEEWVRLKPKDSHWRRGFLLAKVFHEADKVVQTCCLKTHRFGGHFTMSLKNSVGLVARFDPQDGYDYMAELHSSENQRLMIAEINQTHKNHLIVMDATKAFVRGGPESGDLANPNVILAGKDRVAMDAVGVAILRLFGTTPEVSQGRIFQQEQIARAVELGIGIQSAKDIQLIPLDAESEKLTQKIERSFEVE
ncbi:MAG: DUF362 domain-containing protein [Candidatus Bathyarchaeota archaeon]|nr:DUF362 domain-containing protein [Candidatus Bathyarchaeota archaeon]MDH5418806.1 DUF362 domain-containing protein [Candidatus Bathyarchaeota archaeon]